MFFFFIKANKGRVNIGAEFEGIVHCGKGLAVGVWGDGYAASTVKKQRARNAGAELTFHCLLCLGPQSLG